MHHFETDSAVFNYNPDFSLVEITLKDRYTECRMMEIDGMDLLKFVAQCYIAPEKIRRLEQAELEVILFG